ncbi:MoxR-like ATPases [Lachnospiraceae bacterium KM106-2]|nr:MoxR-like ATPases [Lachnospiraceae bacterium KM106-2]
MQTYLGYIEQIKQQLGTVIKGKDEIIEKVLATMLAKGHILIEDIPGVGKTTLALALSKVTNLDYKRLQFTPDVLPSDVVGYSVLTKDGEMEYKRGPILCNLFLADEINRTSSKTQAALLEVMEEGRVTVDGITREVPEPFCVIATQNPVGSIGTQLLPESQLDRFMVRLTMGYPDIKNEVSLLKDRHTVNPLEKIYGVVSKDVIIEMQYEVEKTYIHDEVYEYIARLAAVTRNHELIQLGVSPRGTLAITNMSKALAFMSGRNYVLPSDVYEAVPCVIEHRILLSPKARVSHIDVHQVVQDILTKIPAPQI